VDFTIGLAFFMVIQDGKNSFGHPGWNVGFHSRISGILETGLGFTWMANGENGQRLSIRLSKTGYNDTK
jgi:hypothetical protein